MKKFITSRKIGNFFSKPFFSDYRTIAALWFILVIITFLTKGAFNPEKCNNFMIFRGVFFHTIDQLPLFDAYPDEYKDVNHYGPLFSLIIAPFALLPRLAGLFLWQTFLAATLFYTILKFPFSRKQKITVFWIISLEVLSSLQMQQFNLIIAATVAGSLIAATKNKPSLFAFLVVIGTLTKLYGIVGIVFILFTNRKKDSLLWFAIWGSILFALPMLISSPEYIFSQYGAWIDALSEKNLQNAETSSVLQNISAIGMIHRISRLEFSDLLILVPAAIIFFLPLLRIRMYADFRFRWRILASALMCIILFSTGSESSGYVIAFLGIAIWYILNDKNIQPYYVFLLVFALLICGFGGSDLMPSYIRKEIIRAYALKALPVMLIWFTLIFQLLKSGLPNPSAINHKP
ncbi:MAG: DUF2029 domain-containing protein [Candidatus Amulumruptor caecigallinarius]|nr:DUF2029 domain-containing protein [Candidatus Amulumruptor caecigallinarius]